MKNRSKSENLGFIPKNEKTIEIENQSPIASELAVELIENEINLNVDNNNKNNKLSNLKAKFNIFRKINNEANKIELKEKKEDVIFKLTNEVPRETWSKRLDFLMSIIGFSVDIAGIWRLFVNY